MKEFSMRSRLGKIVINSITATPFTNSKYMGIDFEWESNIGFGHFQAFRRMDSPDAPWECDDEDMGKEFCSLIIQKWLYEMFE